MAPALSKKSAIMASQVVMGPDPITSKDTFQGTDIDHAVNWYRYYFKHKDARAWLDDYVDKYHQDLSKSLKQVPDDKFYFSDFCIAHLKYSGCQVDSEIIERLDLRIRETIESFIPEKISRVVKISSIRKKEENKLLANIEDILDTFFNRNYEYFDPKISDLIRDSNPSQSSVKEVIDYYNQLLEDLPNRDDLTETKKASYQGFIAKILGDSISFLDTTKKPRKSKAKKTKNPEQIVSGVKYLKEYKIGLWLFESVSPTTILQSDIVYIYLPKYKKLTKLVAEQKSSLSIRGTSIVGFDKTLSEAKTIRKPETILIQIQEATKTTADKIFKELKTKSQQATGRLNLDTLIFKVYK